MAFYTSITASIINAEAIETTNAEGVEVYEVKGICTASEPGIPVVMHADKNSTQGNFLKDAAKLVAKENKTMRVLVSGIIQPVLAMKNDETKAITKPPKVIVYVGAARRIQNDATKDPEQAIIFGSGFARPSFDFEDKTKRKPELFISSGTESLTDAGTYSSSLQVLGESSFKTDAKCLEVAEGQEVYFMANMFRSAGQMGDVSYDKLKTSATFMQETDRVRSRKSNGRPKPVSMSAQLSDSFEETDSKASVMSSDDLCKQASVSLADF